MKATAKTPIRVSHFGSGLALTSPVMVQLPSTLDPAMRSLPVNVEFALALNEVYERATKPSDLQRLRNEMDYFAREFHGGSYHPIHTMMRQQLQEWRADNRCGYYDDEDNRTREEQRLDRLGRVALHADLDAPAQHNIFGDEAGDMRFFSPVRAVVEGIIGAVCVTAAVLSFLMAMESFAAFCLAPLACLRFSTRLDGKVRLTTFDQHAVAAMTTKRDKRRIGRMIFRGEDRAYIIGAIAQTMIEREQEEEIESLRERIADHLDTLPAEERKLNPSNLAAVLTAEDYHSLNRELIEAQRALLTELQASKVNA